MSVIEMLEEFLRSRDVDSDVVSKIRQEKHSSIDTGAPTIKFRIRGPGQQRTCQNSYTPGENSQSDWNAGHSSHQLSSYAQYVDLIDSDSDADEGLQDASKINLKIEDSSKLRLSAEIGQFVDGLEELWPLCQESFTLSRTLFIASNTALSFGRMCQLYAVLWSKRSFKRMAAEEDSIYYFECFQAQCESVGNSISLGQILAFWTGTDREPPLGFIVPAIEDERQPLNKPLPVDFYDEKGRLPYASTCGLRLWIPVNVTEEEFNRLLIQAVVECVGFGKVLLIYHLYCASL